MMFDFDFFINLNFPLFLFSLDALFSLSLLRSFWDFAFFSEKVVSIPEFLLSLGFTLEFELCANSESELEVSLELEAKQCPPAAFCLTFFVLTPTSAAWHSSFPLEKCPQLYLLPRSQSCLQ
ncbi:hypothetical protein HWI79_518 [Cryptosporidium felis]|nr:hypothetical protein HWI79_518 [Cryptosporidium felis]